MSSASVTPSTNSRDCERPFGLLDAVDVRDVAMAIAILRAPLGQRFQGDIALTVSGDHARVLFSL